MTTRPAIRRGAAALSLAIVLAGQAATGAQAAPPEHAASAPGGPHGRERGTASFGVIGDTPYGQAAFDAFPSQVEAMNRDRSLEFVAHVGDVKAGSQRCDTSYFRDVRALFDRFTTPLVFTPGDNDWTDCHRATNGGYDPLERMSVLREVFYDRPGHTLGRNMHVRSHESTGHPENVTFEKAGLSFGVINVQGSNNGLLPWEGRGETAPTPAQVAEEKARTQDALSVIDEAFDTAERKHCRAVVIMTQADMFDPNATEPTTASHGAFDPVVERLAERSRAWGRPVYLVNGDSHTFTEDRPLTGGSRWLDFYGERPVPNLQRVTVDGSEKADNYVRFTVTKAPNGPRSTDPDAPVLRWEKVPFTSGSGSSVPSGASSADRGH